MAESKSSRSLSGAAAAEEKALKEGGGGGGGGGKTVVHDDDDIKGPESFTYEPGPGDPESVSYGGKLFEKGKSVEIEDPAAIRKLRRNPYFTMTAEEREKQAEENRAASPETLAAEARAQLTEEELEAARKDPTPIDTRVPEVPQHTRLEMQGQRSRMEEAARKQRAIDAINQGDKGKKRA